MLIPYYYDFYAMVNAEHFNATSKNQWIMLRRWAWIRKNVLLNENRTVGALTLSSTVSSSQSFVIEHTGQTRERLDFKMHVPYV